MQTPKERNGSLNVPKKTSPRPARQLRITGLEPDSSSSSNPAAKTPKDKTPKVLERRSPRSPVSEKKRPSRISELESQVSLLKEELKKAKDQRISSEASKEQAEQDAEDSKKQLLEVSSKLEESQKQLLQLSASEEAQELDSELKSAQKLNTLDEATALASALCEIRQLKLLIEIVASSEAGRLKQAELSNMEIQLLRGNLVETIFLMENFKNQIRDCEVSDAETEALATGTLLQLENIKKTVESLRSDGAKSIESFKKMCLEFEQSKSRVALLEELISKLQDSLVHTGDHEILTKTQENQNLGESNVLEAEFFELRCEVEWLRSALEVAEKKTLEENTKNYWLQREAELESELKKAKSDIDELKGNLMDKETELQCISEENETLDKKLNEHQRETDLENEMKILRETVEDMKANLMDKETELQNITEENETLRSEMIKRETDGQDSILKLGLAMDEADKSKKKTIRVFEQLEAAQASNLELETELRKLKVQSDQWRKAAEAAAAMLSAGNNGKLTENYSPVCEKTDSPYSEDTDNDLLKKKNGNVLKKIGVMWKKPHK